MDFINCTIVENTSASNIDKTIECFGNSNLTLTNCILRNDTEIEINFDTPWYYENELNISYSNIEGGLESINTNNVDVHWLDGNIDGNPMFLGSGNHPFMLNDQSPCVNAGTPDTTGLNLPEYDLAGNPRIFGSGIDMGSYENQNIDFLPPLDPYLMHFDGFDRFGWTPPNGFYESFYVYLNGEFYVITSNTYYDFYDLEAGLYSFGVSAYYTSGDESEIVTIEAYVDASDNLIPLKTEMLYSYPNPFNPEATLIYQVSEKSDIKISVYNSLGQLVNILENDLISAGEYSTKWQGNVF